MARRATTQERLYPTRRVAGDTLWRALGFKNARAFQRARSRGAIALRLYPDPATGGVYALADDLDRHLAAKEEAGAPDQIQ